MYDYNEKNSFSLLEESILLLQNGKATEKKVVKKINYLNILINFLPFRIKFRK